MLQELCFQVLYTVSDDTTAYKVEMTRPTEGAGIILFRTGDLLSEPRIHFRFVLLHFCDT